MVKPDMLDALSDDELRAVIKVSDELLKKRDAERKAKALSDARALLASAGLSLKDIAEKGKKKSASGHSYKGGQMYQHPTNRTLVWNAKGQKPNWLRELEAQGGKAVEIEQGQNDDAATPVRKNG